MANPESPAGCSDAAPTAPVSLLPPMGTEGTKFQVAGYSECDRVYDCAIADKNAARRSYCYFK